MNAGRENNFSVESDVTTILYVDDKPANLNSLKSHFDGIINILTASSGKEALEILKEHPAQVIMAEQSIPDMTGVEFLQKVKAKWTDLKYILLTQYHDNEVIKKADNDVAIYWYMKKPFDYDKFEHIIKKEIEAYNSDHLLRESEEIFRGVFDSSIDVFTRSDIEGKCVLVSPSIYQLTGYRTEEVIGKNLVDFYADPEARTEIVNKLQSTNQVENFEIDILRKDGKKITVSTNAKIYYNSIGEPLGVEGSIRDISKQRKTEGILKKSEELYRITVEQAPIGIVHVSPEGDFIMVNHKFCDITGYKKDDLMGKPFKDITHPDDVEIGLTKLGQMLKDEIKSFTYEKRYIRKDRSIVTVILSTQLIRNELGEPEYFVSIAEDITDKMRAESEHDKLFNSSFDLICIAGFDGYFKEINPFWEQVTGYSLEELYADPFIEFVHPDDVEKTVTEVQELFQGKRAVIGFENRYLTKSGKEIHLSWTVTPAAEEKLMYCIARDITKQKKAANDILEYQNRLKALANEMLLSEEKQRRQIATDLHDNVGQMLAFSRLQIEALNNTMDKEHIMDKLNPISKGLLNAIEATRSTIFELSPPQLNEIGLVGAVSEWIDKEMLTKHKIKCNFSSDNKIYPLNKEIQYLLFMCVRELLINVIKHAGASQVNINVNNQNGILGISIYDDGSGFSYNPEIPQIKEAGFGLFSINERFNSIGGTMLVDTTPGKGTKVELFLPLSDNERS